MKIRNGFVSNSSSSSFLILGKKLEDEEIIKYNSSKTLICYSTSLSDGDDIFEIDNQETLDFLLEVDSIYLHSLNFYYNEIVNNGEWEGKITIKSPEDICYYCICEQDHNSSRNIDELFERYDSDNKSKVRLKYNRRKKLNKLE